MSDSRLVAAAVRPRARDLSEVRALTIEALSKSSSLALTDLEKVIYEAQEVPAPSSTDRVRVEGHSRLHATQIDDSSPLIVRRRLHFALREVLATLKAEGLVVDASGSANGLLLDSVAAEGDGWASNIEFGHDYAPAPLNRIKLNAFPAQRAELLDSEFVEEMKDLLGFRGIDVLSEGIRCYHRGFFIAAVDLLGAASEAAWFQLAMLMKGDHKLTILAANGTNTADVINRGYDELARLRAADRHTLNDLRAQAARFRDLRNYGVHPVGAPDQDREPAFTEAGSAVLYMTAPRYFRQLDAIRLALSTQFPVEQEPPS